MNMRNSFSSVVTLFLITSVTLLSGCSMVSKKSGVDLAENTTSAMQDVQRDIGEANAQIDVTNTSLNNVIGIGSSPEAQPESVKAAFNDYSSNVAKMQQVSDRLNSDIKAMNEQANQYFQNWSEQGEAYTDPDLQQLSQEERARLHSSFNDLLAKSAGLQGGVNAYLSEIRQVETYLSSNLTPTGISNVIPIVQSATRDGDSLKTAFAPVQTALAETMTEMMPGGGAAAGGASPSSEEGGQRGNGAFPGNGSKPDEP